jgi:hypothetical protein
MRRGGSWRLEPSLTHGERNRERREEVGKSGCDLA